MVEYKGSDVRGRTVLDAEGNRVGEIDDVVFDPASWRVQSFTVRVEKDVADSLDVKHGFFKGSELAITPARIQNIGDNVLLNVDRHEIADLLRRRQDEEQGR